MQNKTSTKKQDTQVNMATKVELEKLRQDGLKKLKKPCNREVFVRLRDK
ncbi:MULTISPECIES: hypothetical protein [unclassified Campylobacter]|nr:MULTISPECIES: hypothetical protein [unclassified Campylobacter]MBP3207556.1 hypothetical protein [Campylobacter sp.]MBP5778703.1 hypothetical protein [Campylobacter sp.]MBQ3675281.1 hypothetical protein [Campylobacter sp.]MBQ7270493.1 hypothetical protein [Campylobacter sp.]MBQ9876370.1 hypothetical protein [Campylobacter sp.]